MRLRWLAAVLIGAALLGAVAFQGGGPQAGDTAGEEAEEPALSSGQPIAFPHDTHAGEAEDQFGIDCQFCHFSAERSVDAGIPPVRTCVGCHQVIPGRNQPDEVGKIIDYANRGEAIPWVRIYKVADHVTFPHMRHVQADVQCQECHGQVQEMGVIQDVAQDLSMGWCVSCHVENDVSRDCSVCHY